MAEVRNFMVGSSWHGDLNSSKSKEEGKIGLIKRYQAKFPKVKNSVYEKKFRKAQDEFFRQKKMADTLRSNIAFGSNVIMPFEIFIEDGVIYRIMEYVNSDISHVSDVHTELAPVQIDRLMCTILKGMDAIHKCGIVHADIKNENILIKEVSQGCYTGFIIDTDSSFFEGELLDAEELVISGEYASPEYIRYIARDGKKDGVLAQSITSAIDVFSLGILYHEYLTGKKPETESGLFVGEAMNRKSPIKTCIAKEDTKRRAIIQKMLQPDYKKRPTCAEVIEMIQKKETSETTDK